MKAFVVSVNGKKLCTVGVGTNGVLTTIVTWKGGGQFWSKEGNLRLHVGGLDSNTQEHLRWAVPAELRVGDVVAVEIIEADAVDPEVERYASNHAGRGLSEAMRRMLRGVRERLPGDGMDAVRRARSALRELLRRDRADL